MKKENIINKRIKFPHDAYELTHALDLKGEKLVILSMNIDRSIIDVQEIDFDTTKRTSQLISNLMSKVLNYENITDVHSLTMIRLTSEATRPSEYDIKMAEKMVVGSKQVNIRPTDYLTVNDGNFYSMRERGTVIFI